MKAAEKEALRWFLQSRDDQKFVEWVLKEEVFFDKGCFISQQAGEKALKACLYAMGERRVFGHSLYEMVENISESDARFRQIISEAKRLDRFYIPTRYPNGIPGGSPFQVFDKNDLIRACEDLKAVMELSRTFLQEKGVF
jgi:HEPN domain-containing protein